MHNPIARKLHLRIWLAVAGSVLVLSLLLALAWHQSERERERERRGPPAREVVLRDAGGRTIATGEGIMRFGPERGTELVVTLDNGQVLDLHVAPRAPRGERRGPPPMLVWFRPPYGFVWLVALAGLAVMLGVFPIARRLTQRLEALQRGVQRWGEGRLDERVPVTGTDEVADLARHFNAAAERIEELLRSQSALLQSQKSLLANASHELRSPLARIRMALELLDASREPADAGKREHGDGARAVRQEIARNIAELDQLVDEILLASRLEAPQADLGTLETIDLVALAAEEAARAGADFAVAPDTGPVEVQGVARLLQRAVRNLLENALRHGQRGTSGKPVEVHLKVAGGMAVLQVDDHGPGIPPGQRERIFEPFYRLPSASEREGGVGLGLALVRSIAARHGGSVTCGEHPGAGARFILQLPIAHMHPAAD